MDQKLRRVHPPAFKARVAVEAIKEQKTISQLSSQYGVHPTQITKWKKKALTGLEGLFADSVIKLRERDDGLIRSLYEQVGQLKVENDWLKKKIGLIEG
jgi:transposase-like protein